eukprot:1143137-Pleurochrysis_carterae.AAC.1
MGRLVTASAWPPSRFFSSSQSWTRTHVKIVLPMRAMMNYSHAKFIVQLLPPQPSEMKLGVAQMQLTLNVIKI